MAVSEESTITVISPYLFSHNANIDIVETYTDLNLSRLMKIEAPFLCLLLYVNKWSSDKFYAIENKVIYNIVYAENNLNSVTCS